MALSINDLRTSYPPSQFSSLPSQPSNLKLSPQYCLSLFLSPVFYHPPPQELSSLLLPKVPVFLLEFPGLYRHPQVKHTNLKIGC